MAGSSYVAALLGLVSTVVAARYLGGREYGIYALTLGFPLLIWSFAGTKAQSISVRFLSNYRDEEPDRFAAVARAGYSLDAAAAGVALVLVILLVPIVGRSLQLSGNFAIVYALSFPIYSLIGTSHAALNALLRFKTLAFLQVFDKALMLGSVSAAVLWVATPEAAVTATAIAQSASGVSALIVAGWAMRRRFPPWWKASLRLLDRERTEILGLFGWNYLAVTINGVVGQAPLLVVGLVAGPVAAGFYRVAANIATAVTYVEAALWRVAFPLIANRAAAADADLRNVVKRWVRRGSLPAAVVGVMLLPLVPAGLPVVFGEEFEPAVGGTLMMMMGSLVSLIFFYVNPVFYGMGLVKEWVVVYGPYSVLLLSGVSLATHTWGFVGAAAATALGMATFNSVMAVRVSTLLRNGSAPAP